MNSALIICGNLRSFEQCSSTFEQIITKLNCDVFICVSDKQYELHPYIKQTTGFNNDCDLSRDLILSKLSICKNMTDKIKSVIVIDRIQEDNDIHDNYIAKFDQRKGWLGTDIFKQYQKLNTCAMSVKQYENDNNIKYNYILKTRFDVNINIDSLPSYPLYDNTVYTSQGASEQINDLVLITNTIDTMMFICDNIKKHFFSNIGSQENYANIHTILYPIFKSNGINSIQSIISEVNRDYSNYFDNTITLVTCYYNIHRDNWQNCSRDSEVYFKNAEYILNKKNPIIIFTTEDNVARCKEIRMKTDRYFIYTKIIVLAFEDLVYYDKMNMIRTIQRDNSINIHADDQNYPEFCIPEYIIVINNKIPLLKRVSDENPFNSTIFQWVDFGLHPNVRGDNFTQDYFTNIFYKKNRIRMVGFIPPTHILNKSQYYNSHISTVSAGLFGGDANSIGMLYKFHKHEFELLLSNCLMNQEQYILYYLMGIHKDLFDYSLIKDWNDLCKGYAKTNVRVAICMSGHTRSFALCKQNIIQNIIEPLNRFGCNTNTFFSTWNDIDFTNNMNNLTDICSRIECENSPPDFFTVNYTSQQYLQYPGLCCHTTSPNAASCLYKIQRAYELSLIYSKEHNYEYDIVIRLRPDVVYHNTIDVYNIKHALLYDYLYMPTSPGKYMSVTKGILDSYVYGNKNVMDVFTNTYNMLPSFINTDCVHTAEGYLYKQITGNNITLYRFMSSYGIIRVNNDYIKVV